MYSMFLCGHVKQWLQARAPQTTSMTTRPFHVFGASHVTVLFLTVVITVMMIILARRGQSRTMHVIERVLAFVLLLEWPFNVLISWFTNGLGVDNFMPAQFCDVAAIMGGMALLTKKHEACELLYLWGLAGTLQGLLTPALTIDFPSPRFIGFFALHAGVVIAALYIVLGARITPRAGAVGRAMLWLVVYAITAGVINAMLGSNYGFLCHKPASGSLLDVLGPWPWYVGSIGLVALVFFTLLDLPFARKRRQRGE